MKGMAFVDAYAVFNMFIPLEDYKVKLGKLNSNVSLEDIMICAFDPHRVLIRKKKLEMAIKYSENKGIDSEIADYLQNYVFYEEFEKWLFFPEKYKSDRFLLREIKGLCAKHSVEELKDQKAMIEKKRDVAVKRALRFACCVSDIDQYLILPAIVTEEEKRHMIECKLLYCVGRNIEKIDMDISRSDITTIERAIRRRQIYGE